MSEYVRFGDEWKKEVMRLKKSEIVDMLANALRKNASRPKSNSSDADKGRICPGCGSRVKGTCWSCVGDGGLRDKD